MAIWIVQINFTIQICHDFTTSYTTTGESVTSSNHIIPKILKFYAFQLFIDKWKFVHELFV